MLTQFFDYPRHPTALQVLRGSAEIGVAGVIVDDVVLAHEEVPKEATQRPQFTPRIALAQESGRLMPSVGLGGSF